MSDGIPDPEGFELIESPAWVFVGFATECDLCGGSEDVHRYEHTETGEQKAMCNPCEQAT